MGINLPSNKDLRLIYLHALSNSLSENKWNYSDSSQIWKPIIMIYFNICWKPIVYQASQCDTILQQYQQLCRLNEFCYIYAKTQFLSMDDFILHISNSES